MNCECMYMLHPEDQTIENYLSLAQKVDGKGNFERIPVAVSVITRPVKVCNDINVQGGWVSGKEDTLMPGNMVLFVQGKLHYMGSYFFSFSRPSVAMFPNDDNPEPFFKDIITITEDFDYENVAGGIELSKLPAIEDAARAEETYRYMYNMIFDLPPEDFSFDGKRVALFGKFSAGKKSEVEERIKSCGGIISKSVGNSTDVLIVGDMARFDCCAYGGRGVQIENALFYNRENPKSIAIYEERYALKKISW